MSEFFQHYPSNSRITFFPADINDVRRVFEQFPHVWQSLPGVPRFRNVEPHPVFHKILDGPTSIHQWQDVLLPQNYDTRFLFVDVDLDGWTAVVSVHDHSNPFQGWVARGVITKLLERDGYQRLADLPEFSSISLSYDFEPSMLTTQIYLHHASLQVEVASTRTQFSWTKNSTYDVKVPWFVYDCQATGREPYKGLDLPPIEHVGGSVDESLPAYLRPDPEKVQAFGFRPERLYERWDKGTGRDDYLTVLPFDSTGHDRVTDFFSTKIVAQWLRDNHGICWDDPTFYEGDSLLYTVGAPGGISDPFIPRIPVETYHRFQGIDAERNRDLIDREKF